MKLKLTLITLIGLLFLGITEVKAQSDSVKFSPSHLKAAERALMASGLADNMQKMFDQVIDVQSNQIPEGKREAFKTVMHKFINKYIDWQQIEKAFEPIYASEFSEDELNKIADFLSSPAGKAMTAKQPELFQKGAAWGMKMVQDHKEDLEQMMKDAMGQ